MAQAVTVKVPFNVTNVAECMCPNCPVQGNSACVHVKLAAMNGSLKKDPLEREDVPGEYCSTGTATCLDLNPKKSCICGTCNVFQKYELAAGKPGGYFCQAGFARQA